MKLCSSLAETLPLSEAQPSRTEYRTLINVYMDVVSHDDMTKQMSETPRKNEAVVYCLKKF